METPSKPAHARHERLHEELKRRAYQFFEQKESETSGTNLNDELKDELPRIAYALSLVQECGDSYMSDDKAYRAARVYLSALSSFVAVRRQHLVKAGARIANADQPAIVEPLS